MVCVLSSQDSLSLTEQDVNALSGSGYDYLEIICMNLGNCCCGFKSIIRWNVTPVSLAVNDLNPLAQRGDGETSPLLVDGRRRDILTAFQRYRNSRLSADFQTEITDRSLAECLDECLRQVGDPLLSFHGKGLWFIFYWWRRAIVAGRLCTRKGTACVDSVASIRKMDDWFTTQITTITKVFQVCCVSFLSLRHHLRQQ